MDELCTACLCAGRKLHSIGETGSYNLYKQILNEILVREPVVSVKICWECCERLRRFREFKALVKTSYTRLLQHQNERPQLPKQSLARTPSLRVQRLASLKIPDQNVKQESEEDDEEPSYLEIDLKPLKEEWLDSDLESEDLPDDVEVETVKKKRTSVKPQTRPKGASPKKGAGEREKSSEGQPEVSDDELKCPECAKTFSTKQSCKAHIAALHARARRYACPRCRSAYTWRSSLYKHIRNNHKDINLKRLKAQWLDSELETGSLDAESKTTKKKKTFVKLVTFKLQTRHKTLPKVRKEERKKRVPSPRGEPTCPECGKTFKTMKTCRDHINALHTLQHTYTCAHCGKAYRWKTTLCHHIHNVHKVRDKSALYCQPCDKLFATVATYKKHMNLSRRHLPHSGSDANFTCEECGETFWKELLLRDHVDWVHLKRIKYRCKICDKPFKNQAAMYVHKHKVHRAAPKEGTDGKDHLCHICGKSYKNEHVLKYHIVAMHTSEKPYRCPQCAAAFRWQSSMYRHLHVVHYKDFRYRNKKKKKPKRNVLSAPSKEIQNSDVTCV